MLRHTSRQQYTSSKCWVGLKQAHHRPKPPTRLEPAKQECLHQHPPRPPPPQVQYGLRMYHNQHPPNQPPKYLYPYPQSARTLMDSTRSEGVAEAVRTKPPLLGCHIRSDATPRYASMYSSGVVAAWPIAARTTCTSADNMAAAASSASRGTSSRGGTKAAAAAAALAACEMRR